LVAGQAKKEVFVMMTARIIQIILGVAGSVALLLGLLFWIANIDLIGIHMLFGLIVTLALLVMSIIAISTRGLRIWGLVGVVYALIVPVFGLTQSAIFPGNLHWLIQAAHMLVGIGALVLAGIMSVRYMTIKQTMVRSANEPQMVR
jgi:hypothetical protein